MVETIEGEDVMYGFLYIVWVYDFIERGEPVYKIGTTKNICRRMREYPKKSVLLFSMYNDDYIGYERYLIKKFEKTFTLRRDLGHEYFEGDVNKMMEIMFTYTSRYSKLDASIGINKLRYSFSVIPKSVKIIRPPHRIQKDHITKVYELFDTFKKNDDIPWSPILVANEDKHDGVELTDGVLNMRAWLDKIALDIYGMDKSKLDKRFYDTFVNVDKDKAFALFCKTKRYLEFQHFTKDVYDRMHDVFSERDNTLNSRRLCNYYMKLTWGKKILDAICPEGYLNDLLSNNPISQKTQDVRKKFQECFDSISSEEYSAIIQSFGMNRSFSEKKDWDAKRCSHFLKDVVGKSFGIKYNATDRGSTKEDGYIVIRTFSAKDMNRIINKYKPTCLVNMQGAIS